MDHIIPWKTRDWKNKVTKKKKECKQKTRNIISWIQTTHTGQKVEKLEEEDIYPVSISQGVCLFQGLGIIFSNGRSLYFCTPHKEDWVFYHDILSQMKKLKQKSVWFLNWL